MGYSPWGRKESDKTERLNFHFLLVSGAGSPISELCDLRHPGTGSYRLWGGAGSCH